MADRSDEFLKLRLDWLQRNVLTRVERSAADGAKISAWLVTGTAGLFVLALKTEHDSARVTVGTPVLGLLLLSLGLAALGALSGYLIGTLSVAAYDDGTNEVEDELRLLLRGPEADAAHDKSGRGKGKAHFDSWVPMLIPLALVSHALSGIVLLAGGLAALMKVTGGGF